MLRWLIVILAAAAIFFLTYQKLTTNVWGLTAFLCQLLAVIELAFGLQFVEAGWSRKTSSRMPLDEHYEYALYMYHIQSVRDLATNNRMLLLIASLEIQLGKYDHATQTITQISVGKCTPVQLKQLYYMQILLAAEVGDTDTKNQFLTRYTGISDTNGEYPSEAELTTWIEAEEMDRLISALKKFTPTRNEIQQAKVIDLNDRVLNLDNPDDKMISAFANYAVQTENWQQNALQALRSDKEGLTPEKLLVLQDHVLNYNVEVSLVGTLARKIVAAVETLTRS